MNRNHRCIKLITLALCSLVWACSPPSDEVSHVGHAETGCRVLDPDISDAYVGECRDGMAHGEGEARGRDIYIGGFYAGEPHGTGRYMWGPTSQWANHTYEGDLVHGERTGTGIYRSPTYEYEGQFLRGRHHGTGKYTVHGEFVYDGQFVDGSMHGEGEVTVFSSGIVYKGEFKNNSIDGYGVFIYRSGNQLEGQFRDGKAEGIAELRVPRSETIGTNLRADGFWRDDYFVLRGYWRDGDFLIACEDEQDCWDKWETDKTKSKKDAEEWTEKLKSDIESRELAQWSADMQRQIDENRQQEDSKRQARQLCNAQKTTCLAACASGTSGSSCRASCNRIYCF